MSSSESVRGPREQHEAEMETEIIPPASSNGDTPQQSVIAALRAKREEHTTEVSWDLEVPGWGGMLVLRCGPIPPAQLNRLVQLANTSKSKSAALDATSDMLIAACREVWGRTDELHELVQIFDEEGEPLRIDKRLAETLKLTDRTGQMPERARQVLLAMFGSVPSPELGIGTASSDYVEWARGANAEVDEELLGE